MNVPGRERAISFRSYADSLSPIAEQPGEPIIESGQVVQQESSRKQNGHSLSEMPVSINRCYRESYDSSRGGTRTPDPVINSQASRDNK
jgi:hypothetical protein